MELWLIAAVARDGAIGRAGTMPWHLPQDLAHFKRTTLGCPVVMGRKTWESLPPHFRPLPGRRNVVVTRNAAWQADGAEAAPSLDAALERLREAERVFVIGGGELYAQALPRADGLVLTEVDIGVPDADTHFPAWDRNAFSEAARESHTDGAPWPYHFVRYERIRR
ncbi:MULTISPECIES: dihydrofolate reductase [unclassified Methylibium]|uniref:dihydrofolate reductase n=1 Tax=unclassified Methylibium TaxID=2633235 RepID=UPI0003F3CE0C|nr:MULTISPECIES: dihydrofolate reductase [unclassified Methylibium]EWS55170.1 Dihydrofolate reductase type 3 [Methylibium sp. T29]EWS59525.1 Dihydrofolate reductase type 3 [Methylibium sp. T29-B]